MLDLRFQLSRANTQFVDVGEPRREHPAPDAAATDQGTDASKRTDYK